MSRRVISATPKTTFRELWRLIFRRHVNALPIIDASNKLVGLVTKEDLLASLYPDYHTYLEELTSASDFEAMEEKVRDGSSQSAVDIMCRRVIYTRVDTPIMRALSRMIVRRVNQLPVVSDDGKVVGMVTKGDIFRALFRANLGRKKR